MATSKVYAASLYPAFVDVPVVLHALRCPKPASTSRAICAGWEKLPPLCPGSMTMTLPAREPLPPNAFDPPAAFAAAALDEGAGAGAGLGAIGTPPPGVGVGAAAEAVVPSADNAADDEAGRPDDPQPARPP